MQLDAQGKVELKRAEAAGHLLINSLDAVSLADSATAGSNLTVIASSLDMADGSRFSTGGTLALTTTGDMRLGLLDNTGTAATQFLVKAGGLLLANGDGQVNLRGTHAGIAELEAGLGIGTEVTPLLVDLPKLTQVAAITGDIFLQQQNELRIDELLAQNGWCSVTTGACYQQVCWTLIKRSPSLAAVSRPTSSGLAPMICT